MEPQSFRFAPVFHSPSPQVITERYALHIQSEGVFDWDRHNLNKIKAHGINAAEVEEALAIGPIPIYEQDADREPRYELSPPTSWIPVRSGTISNGD